METSRLFLYFKEELKQIKTTTPINFWHTSCIFKLVSIFLRLSNQFSMKPLFIICLLTVSALYANSFIAPVSFPEDPGKVLDLNQSGERMSANTFKLQEFCRAELANFEFDVKFEIISGDVYFTGANFTRIEQGAINSNSLKPIKEIMKRCIPGSIVTFDNIKVKGPDNKIRTIPGVSYVLY